MYITMFKPSQKMPQISDCVVHGAMHGYDTLIILDKTGEWHVGESFIDPHERGENKIRVWWQCEGGHSGLFSKDVDLWGVLPASGAGLQ
jgi:hypothetical protein